MLSRPLSLATVTVLVGCLAAGSAYAQATNLEAGKSPSQIFSSTCSACHKSARGLLKTVGATSLPGFLRQHYTTSSDMASVLASYLVSNGAADPRYQAKQGKDAKQEAARPGAQPDQLDRFGRRIRPAPAQEVARPDGQQQPARPDADGLGPRGEGGRAGRNAKRQGRPGEAAPDATNPQPVTDFKSGSRQKLSKRGKPGEDLAKPDAAKSDAAKSDAAKPEAAKPDVAKPEDPAQGEPAKEDVKSDTAKVDPGRPELDKTDAGQGDAGKLEGAKPASELEPETAKADAPKETGGREPTPQRPDPVPPVTPAPPGPPAASAASGSPEPAVTSPPAAASPEPTATTASAPPIPAVPAGPPAPPISK